MSRLHSYTDDCLVSLLQEGRCDAFDEIYSRYHGAIYRNIFKLIKDSTATEDLVQDAFIAFWQKRSGIDARKSLAGWLFVISYNLSVNWLKRKLVETKAATHLKAVETEETDVAGSYEEQMKVIEKAMLQLTPQKKRVLELCKLQGRSYKAAAREMNISSHTVKEYLTVAMKSVRKYAASGYKLFW